MKKNHEIPDELKLKPQDWNFLDAEGKAAMAYKLNSKEYDMYSLTGEDEEWYDVINTPVKFIVQVVGQGSKSFYYYSDARAYMSSCLAMGFCAVLKREEK